MIAAEVMGEEVMQNMDGIFVVAKVFTVVNGRRGSGGCARFKLLFSQFDTVI